MKKDLLEPGKYPTSQESWDAWGQHALRILMEGDREFAFPPAQEPEVSIIVVLHNKAHLSLLCFQSILDNVHVPYELLIVDNQSTDHTRTMLSRCTGATVILNEENIGFGEACMQAIQHSRGRILLFLNNDALLTPDSMVPALMNFRNPSVGAVGGSILLSDGSLQEAGSIIWSDGSALGYGRLDDPSRPAYQFRRPVDYCSGAFLFTPQKLFLSLGGFDSYYAPAYYEDTDYCMKVWRAGLQVIYEPEAVIRHYESASSEGNRNAMPRMEKNKRLFVTRWRKALDRHLPLSRQNILKSRIASSSTGLRIIYIDDRVPQRELGAGFPRSNDVLRCLVAEGHHVVCVPFNFPVGSLETEYKGIPRDVELLDVIPDPSTFYGQYLPLADLVWISRPHNMARFLDDIAGGWEFSAKLVYDAEAIFSHRDRIHLSLTGKKSSAQILDARVNRELALSHAADAVTVVSDRDAEAFRASGVSNLHTLGHCLSPVPTMKTFAARRTFLFVGAVHGENTPNADSMRYFCREIWPNVFRRTGSELVIAGLGTDQHLNVTGQGIRIEGRVDNLRRLFEDARVFVVPTRYAAGIPFKAHEAAAYGVPMVVSPLIMEQLGWRHAQDLLTGSDAEEFADLCTTLYSQAELWNKLRANALSRVVLDFSPGNFRQRIAEVINSVFLPAFGEVRQRDASALTSTTAH
jgi:O-antigen biosynthesis protein